MQDNPIEVLKKLLEIPNAPFSIKGRSEYLKQLFIERGLEYKETEYYLSVKLNSLAINSPKIIFVSHLDHPGFVFKNNRVAKAFGSLYLHKVKNYKPISVFNPQGEYLGDVKLLKSYGKDESWIEVESNFDIPANSQGLWNVGDLKVSEGKIKARSHDNDIATSILISNLKSSSQSKYEIVYLFTKHEEVLQQSAYHIAKYNSLDITSNDIVINMESMKVYPISDIDEFSNLTYTDGPVLNISEASGIYTEGSRNLGESLLSNIALSQDLKLQRGLAGGSSDARVFSLFKLTPNIVTLNIPNEYKHNVNGDTVCSEEVNIDDINTVNLIVKYIIDGGDLSDHENHLDISGKIKERAVKSAKNTYRKLNDRLDIANRAIVKRGYYFPESFMDTILDYFFRFISYLKFYLSFKKESNLSKD